MSLDPPESSFNVNATWADAKTGRKAGVLDLESQPLEKAGKLKAYPWICACEVKRPLLICTTVITRNNPRGWGQVSTHRNEVQRLTHISRQREGIAQGLGCDVQ